MISWGMVVPASGISTRRRRAASTALRTASLTSFALPVAIPTRPCPSPTATSALKPKRRPPFRSDQAAAGGFDRLAHRLAHLVCLAGGDPDAALPVAHRDERVEAEAPAALHDLRHAVDGNDVLDEPVALALALARVAPLPPPPPTPAPPGPGPPSATASTSTATAATPT